VQEVEGRSQSVGAGALRSLGFWALALPAMVLFGVSVLAQPMADRRAALHRQAIEQARTDQLQRLADDLAILRKALTDDPEYVARRAREDLGYRRSGERPLPFDVETTGIRIEPVTPAEKPMTRWECFCRGFERPVARSAAMVISVMALATAMLLFDIPTRPRQTRA